MFYDLKSALREWDFSVCDLENNSLVGYMDEGPRRNGNYELDLVIVNEQRMPKVGALKRLAYYMVIREYGISFFSFISHYF